MQEITSFEGIADVAAPIQNNPMGIRKARSYTLKDVKLSV
jgi:hypothetical protein